MYFFSNTLVSQGSLRKKKYIFYNSGDSWGGVKLDLERMLVSAKLTFLWSGGNGVRSSCFNFQRILRILWSILTYFVKRTTKSVIFLSRLARNLTGLAKAARKYVNFLVRMARNLTYLVKKETKYVRCLLRSVRKLTYVGKQKTKDVRFLSRLARSLIQLDEKETKCVRFH